MNPVWSGGGNEVFYEGQDNQIMVAAYAARADSSLKKQLFFRLRDKVAHTIRDERR